MGVVALWRVTLFIFFLVRSARLNWWRALIGVLFPLSIIVCVLYLNNIAASIADGMAGTRAPQSTPVQEFTKSTIALASYSFLPLLFAYVWTIFTACHDYTSQHE